MTGIKYCMWANTGVWINGMRLVDTCNLQARPDDDLCATHRAQVDAEVRKFEAEYRRMAA